MPNRSTSDAAASAQDEYIQARPADGSLLTPDGRRVAALPETLLQALHRGRKGSAPDQARQAIYRAGYEWGLQEMLQLSEHLRDEFSDRRDLWQMDAPFVLERWAAPFAATGWGACIFDLTSHDKGLMFVELRQSAAAAAVGETAVPACDLYAGLFAGALSFYDRAESHAIETECVALGHACCRFIVGPGRLIDQAETARHSGRSHDAICRLLLEARASSSVPPAAKAAKIPWKK